MDVTSYCQFFFGSKIATWSPVRLQKNGKLLNLSEIVNSEIAWFKDPNSFSINGISQQKSSNNELRELVLSYIRERGREDVTASSIRSVVSRGLGERGRLPFGEVTARLAPDSERILGEWVMK